MRSKALLTVIAVVTVASVAHAASYDAIIQKPNAEVRGGQSAVFPVTGMLPQGTRVKVIREEGGWAAIAPPEGSSSWVMERVLDQQPVVGRRTPPLTILADNTEIMLGSPSQATPHPFVVNKVQRGTMVVVVGEKSGSDVTGEKTTWWRVQPTGGEVRWISKEALTPGVAKPTATASASNPAPSGTLTSRQTPPPVDTPSGPWAAGVNMTSGPGILRRSAFLIEGQPAYVVEDERGNPRIYVVAQQGLNLQPFVNRKVELFGPITNRAELTGKGYMTVTTLHLLK